MLGNLNISKHFLYYTCNQTKAKMKTKKTFTEKQYKLEITESERYKLERLVQQELSTICFHEYGDSPEKIFMQELLKKLKSL